MSLYNVLLSYGGLLKVEYIISGDNYNIDLKTYLTNLGIYSPGITDATITIAAGAYIGSTNTSQPALTISGFSGQDKLTIINNGTIVGCAGRGGNNIGWPTGENGLPGGTGILATYPFTIQNYGVVAGGGGGGAGGSGGNTGGGRRYQSGGGGGGGGFNPGAGGVVITATYTVTGPGSPGTRTAGGAGAQWAGNGGPPGVPGTASSNLGYGNNQGGAGGKYIVGSQYATWNPTGTLLGGAA